MKFIHLSDFHLGKRVNEYSMLEDQEYILKKIINIVDAEKPDGVIIAGDVYDKSVPAAEAVQLFDNFLVQLAKRKLEVFVRCLLRQCHIINDSHFRSISGMAVSVALPSNLQICFSHIGLFLRVALLCG